MRGLTISHASHVRGACIFLEATSSLAAPVRRSHLLLFWIKASGEQSRCTRRLLLCGPQPAGRWREGGGSLGLGGIRGRGEREIVEFFRARNTRLRVGTDGQPVSSKSFLEFPPRGCVIARAESVRGAREKESEHHSRGIPLRKRRCLSGKGRKEGRRNSKGSSPVFFCRFRFARRQTRPKASYKVSKNCTPMFEKS